MLFFIFDSLVMDKLFVGLEIYDWKLQVAEKFLD